MAKARKNNSSEEEGKSWYEKSFKLKDSSITSSLVPGQNYT